MSQTITRGTRPSARRGSAGTIAVLDEDEVAPSSATSSPASMLDGAQRVRASSRTARAAARCRSLLSAVHGALHGRVSRITVLVALGTHARDERGRAGAPSRLRARRAREAPIRRRPSSTTSGGTLPPSRTSAASTPSGSASCPNGMLHEAVEVRINRAVVEHDVTIIVGPVFPHEVVGFSGGNKYLFPGVAGQELIDFSHWLGALITSAEIIGTRGITPVRALINEAAVARPRRPARALRGRAVGHGGAARGLVRRPRGRRGRRRPTSPPRRTCATSTRRCAASCR